MRQNTSVELEHSATDERTEYEPATVTLRYAACRCNNEGDPCARCYITGEREWDDVEGDN